MVSLTSVINFSVSKRKTMNRHYYHKKSIIYSLDDRELSLPLKRYIYGPSCAEKLSKNHKLTQLMKFNKLRVVAIETPQKDSWFTRLKKVFVK